MFLLVHHTPGHVCGSVLLWLYLLLSLGEVVSVRYLHYKMTIFAFVDEKAIWGKIPVSVSSCSMPGSVRGTEYHGLQSRHREPIDDID